MLWGRVRGNTQPAATLGQATGRGRNRGIEILNTTTQLIATLCNVDSFCDANSRAADARVVNQPSIN
jgi:hypothetical protein